MSQCGCSLYLNAVQCAELYFIILIVVIVVVLVVAVGVGGAVRSRSGRSRSGSINSLLRALDWI